jgi:hypothetical protein
MKQHHISRTTRRLRLCLLALLSSFILHPSSFAAEAPLYIPFQGQVTDQNRNLVADGQYSVIFNLYDQAVGGQPVWSERHTKIGVTRGMINVFLGSISTLANVDFSQTKYLGITVDADNLATTADPEMVPRSLIIPSFHSMNSNKLAGYDWSPLLADGSNNPLTGFLRGDKIKVGTISADRLDASAVDSLSGSLVQSSPVFTALERIEAFNAVAVTTDGSGNSRIVKASTADGARSAFYGFAKAAADPGQPVTVQQYGPLAGFTGLVTGMSHYLGAVHGQISVTGGAAPIYVGHAMSSSVLFVDSFGATRSWGGSNYWGDGSDGALNTTKNESFDSTLDGEIVVKQFTNLTINAGHTVTTSNRCRGLVIYVNGDCTINGTLSMTARGASVNPVAIPDTGIRIVRIKSDGPGQSLAASELGGTGTGEVGNAWKNVEMLQRGAMGNGEIYTIAKVGGGGGAAIYRWDQGGVINGNPGLAKEHGTGGGGSGAVTGGTSGRGGAGTCYSGGAGGGGRAGGNGSDGFAGPGSDYGGAGGYGSHQPHNDIQWGSCGGGAGNPGGAGADGGYNGPGFPGGNGTGGLLVLLVKGNLTIGATGTVESRGSPGGSGNRAGGSSGGGRILILHAGTYAAANQPTAAGGPIVVNGGAGGAGSVTIDRINP